MANHTADLVLLEEDELEERLTGSRRELFNLRFQLATGQLDNPSRVRHVRREVARVLTILREREIAEAEGTYIAPSEADHEAARARIAADDEAEAEAAAAAARARRGEEEEHDHDHDEEGDLDTVDDVDAEAHDHVDDEELAHEDEVVDTDEGDEKENA
jgi:large subunit ribosomal protein L29